MPDQISDYIWNTPQVIWRKPRPDLAEIARQQQQRAQLRQVEQLSDRLSFREDWQVLPGTYDGFRNGRHWAQTVYGLIGIDALLSNGGLMVGDPLTLFRDLNTMLVAADWKPHVRVQPEPRPILGDAEMLFAALVYRSIENQPVEVWLIRLDQEPLKILDVDLGAAGTAIDSQEINIKGRIAWQESGVLSVDVKTRLPLGPGIDQTTLHRFEVIGSTATSVDESQSWRKLWANNPGYLDNSSNPDHPCIGQFQQTRGVLIRDNSVYSLKDASSSNPAIGVPELINGFTSSIEQRPLILNIGGECDLNLFFTEPANIEPIVVPALSQEFKDLFAASHSNIFGDCSVYFGD